MARGVASPVPNPLPKVSFVKITDEITQQPPGVHDHIARSYGYNDFSEFFRPEHYIRYIEPLESDLAVQVEYDMDEQDQEWLDALNNERKAQQLDKVSYETFEIVMDRLEKEWFNLTKNIPKSDMVLPSEDSTCAVCDDSEGENTNAIVFCDGCNLAVHQDCYGVPYIPEGQWLCRKCTVSPENPVSCVLCPNEGGAFKQTNSGDWVHLLCAIWVPETGVANEIFMEPISGVEKISKQRWRLRCLVCEIRHGACIQCSKASCFTAFHATCARKEKLLMPMKATQGSEAPTLACYCEKHLPREQLEARALALGAEHSDSSETDAVHATKSNKTARAYAKTYKPGPPLVPRIIVNRILQYITRIQLRHKPEFVFLVCRYWSLKREARRGAPLLKRLHLEPWTALSGSKQQSDEEKALKIDHMRRLRMDLERLRTIADLVQKREHTKQKQADEIQSVLLHFLFPHEAFLRLAFQKITLHDRQGYFKTPVNKAEVPDYYDVIKNPMCWDMIDQKLDRHEYLDLAEFKRDIGLVLDNAMVYNHANTTFYKAAVRIRGIAHSTLAELDRLVQCSAVSEPEHESEPAPGIESEAGGTASELEPTCVEDQNTDLGSRSAPTPYPPAASAPEIGNLEPPVDILELLVSEPSIRAQTDLIVTSTPIESLLNLELPLFRPPPPPPPPAPPSARRKSSKGKFDRRAALERKRLERQTALDASPGFRAPRTRSAIAAAVAFEAEATGEGAAEAPEAGPSTASSSGSSSGLDGSRPRKPRKSAVVPPPDLPLVVEDVDSRQSFKMFEQGWILPPDQKRGGRSVVDRLPLPPPRKRTKSTHTRSRLSNADSGLGEMEFHPPAPDDISAETMEVEPVVESIFVAGSTSGPPEPASPTVHEGVYVPEPDDVSSAGPSNVSDSLLVSEEGSSLELEGLLRSAYAPEFDLLHVSADHTGIPEPTVMPDPTSLASSPHPANSATILQDSHAIEPQANHTVVMEVDEPFVSEVPEFVPDGESAFDVQVAQSGLDVSQGESSSVEAVVPAPEVNEGEGPAAEVSKSEPASERTNPTESKASVPPAAPKLRRKHTGSSHIIWIDELDTPTTRREKHARRKAERDAALRRAQEEALVAERSAAAMDVDSDLTDLSDAEEVQAMVVPPPVSVARRPPAALVEPAEPGAIVLKKGEKLEGGTLVWAKIGSYPWWPAVVFEDDDVEVPKGVLASAPDSDDGQMHGLVRFYEKNQAKKNWAWVKLKNMRYLGEDDALDAQMLAPTSKYQRWRNANRRAECRNAFQDALAEMEAETEGAMPGGEASADQYALNYEEAADAGDPEGGREAEDVLMGLDSPMTDVG